jgi:hypothetical protein
MMDDIEAISLESITPVLEPEFMLLVVPHSRF